MVVVPGIFLIQINDDPDRGRRTGESEHGRREVRIGNPAAQYAPDRLVITPRLCHAACAAVSPSRDSTSEPADSRCRRPVDGLRKHTGPSAALQPGGCHLRYGLFTDSLPAVAQSRRLVHLRPVGEPDCLVEPELSLRRREVVMMITDASTGMVACGGSWRPAVPRTG